MRKALTLLEVLVVLVILAILVALLLPALQHAREAARRMGCGSNLKSIGLAVHNYELTGRRFPPGGIFYANNAQPDYLRNVGPSGDQRYSGDRNNRGSVHFYLLPHLDQNNLYSWFNPAWPIDDARLPAHVQGGQPLRGVRLPMYLCPSDPNQSFMGFSTIVQPSNYATSSGPTADITDNPDCPCSDFTRYRSEGRPNTSEFNPAGVFSRRGYHAIIRPESILDGLSFTIFFGEVRADSSDHVRLGWSHSNKWGAFTQIPINYESSEPNASAAIANRRNSCRARCTYSTSAGFKSRHPGGAQFLFGDGSVRFLSEEINMVAYNRLGDKADGENASLE
jgi:prepilin-type N-terminal cleavage/methylation domain-containing protein/prepilin-type processing-associated H-X9-DG protein